MVISMQVSNSMLIFQSPSGLDRGNAQAPRHEPRQRRRQAAPAYGISRRAQLDDDDQPEDQHKIRRDPGDAVESGLGGRGHHGSAIFLDERLQGEIVIVAAIHRGNQFRSHAVGIGASDVIAFQQNLVAAADAHHAMAKIVEAGGFVPGTEQGEEGEG